MRTLHTAPLLRLERDGEPVPEHGVLVSGDRIEAVGSLAELTEAHPEVRVRRWPGTLGPGRLWAEPLPAAPTPRERVHALLRTGVTAVLADRLADPALRGAVDRSDLLVLAGPVAPTLVTGGRADLSVHDVDGTCLATVVAGRIVHRRA
ncbi:MULTISPECIES: imidazolonepropionase-like domain-containing protein [unclassified Micromonospora]|uniref:imidazolonepropionase-like domain-containing protein n=1 Tax=unclassified Micromonospora TaxID=2617518 RepID=UPI0033FB4B18